MYWQEDNKKPGSYRVPDEIFDLIFELKGKQIPVDHAEYLAHEISALISAKSCQDIAIHQIRIAESGNGWNRPVDPQALMHLSRRTRLILRIRKETFDDIQQLVGAELNIDGHNLIVGESKVRALNPLSTLFARAIACDQKQSEDEFLSQIAEELLLMNIRVKKMICGTTGFISRTAGQLFIRSCLIADLTQEESVRLQQKGIGQEQILGCGLFVPHKGIDAVYSKQE